MKKDQHILTLTALQKALDAVSLVEASLNDICPFDAGRTYSPKEREPYDALSDRFVRSVEVSIRFFRSYEKLMYVESSDTLRDLLQRMEKLLLVSSVHLWIEMRDVRNRLVHDYLPEQIKALYDLIMGEFGRELTGITGKLTTIKQDLKDAVAKMTSEEISEQDTVSE